MAFFKKLLSGKNEVDKREIKKQPTGEKNIKSYDKEITKNRVVLFLIPNKIYQVELLRITKSVADKWSKILYISLNKPAEKVIETFGENNIDTKKFLFVDAITKGVKPNVSDHGITYINSPKNYEQFNIELNQILEKEKFECLIFDSLSTMLTYQDEKIIIRFAHDLLTRLIVAHASGEVICLLKDINTALVKNISMFADGVVDMKKEEIRQEDSKNKEKIQKLEKELKSIRQAYAAKFVSERSYLKTKERIEKNLEKLRK